MNLETWLILAVASVAIPWLSWLSVTLISVQRDYTAIQRDFLAMKDRQDNQEQNCKAHQALDDKLWAKVERIDKNIGRLCLALKIDEAN